MIYPKTEGDQQTPWICSAKVEGAELHDPEFATRKEAVYYAKVLCVRYRLALQALGGAKISDDGQRDEDVPMLTKDKYEAKYGAGSLMRKGTEAEFRERYGDDE